MELEYKFALDNEAQGLAILRSAEDGSLPVHILDRHTIVMASHYFDTPSRSLRRAGWSLRLRGENEKNVLCIKRTRAALPGALRLREEYECEAASLEEGLARIRENGVDEAFFRLCAEGLAEIAQVHFVREARLAAFGSARAELAFDSGHFGRCPGKNRFSEFEIEYKQGQEADFSRLAALISARFSLVPQEKSKLARALEAADGKA